MTERSASPTAQPNSAYARHLGIRITRAELDEVEAEMLVTPELLNTNQSLHGGAVMSLADQLGGFATMLNLAPGQWTTTVESKTGFFRPLMPGEIARAVAIPLHRGRRTMVWQTSIYTPAGKLAAQVTQTQMVMDGPKPRQ